MPIRYKFAALLVASSCLGSGGPVGAQEVSPTEINRRIDLLEESIAGLRRDVSDLAAQLKRLLPPPPVEDIITPFELNVGSAAIEGDVHARVVLVEYTDYQCPFCGRHAQTTYPGIKRQYVDTGKIKYVVRNLPLEALHPLAMKAAQAAECAHDQGKYWEMHDHLFANQRALGIPDITAAADLLGLDHARFTMCIDRNETSSRVLADIAEAQSLGLTATPAFFVGVMKSDEVVLVTQRILGAQPPEVFRATLERSLSSQVTPPDKPGS